jgi:hypothetical protein
VEEEEEEEEEGEARRSDVVWCATQQQKLNFAVFFSGVYAGGVFFGFRKSKFCLKNSKKFNFFRKNPN